LGEATGLAAPNRQRRLTMAALIRWRPGGPAGWRDPFREMAHLQREMSRLWDSSFGERNRMVGTGVFPALNVSEDDECVYVRAELPGVNADDLDLTTQDDTLVIKGERKIPEIEGVNYHRREREAGVFQRAITLPVQIDEAKISAVFRDGVLTLTLPKAPESRPQRIAVKTN
jgi:HSP20 family protein